MVVPVGSHRIEPAMLENIYGTLEETPIAQVALAEDRVVEITGDLARWIPERYATSPGGDPPGVLRCPLAAVGSA